MASESIIIILLCLLIAYILFFNKSDCDKDKTTAATTTAATKFSWFKPTIPNHLATRYQQPNPISGNDPAFNPMATPTKFSNPISGNEPAFNPMATPTKFTTGASPSSQVMCPTVEPCPPATVCPRVNPCPSCPVCPGCPDCSKVSNELNTRINTLTNELEVTRRLCSGPFGPRMVTPSPSLTPSNLSSSQRPPSMPPGLATMFSNNIVRNNLATFSYPLNFATKGSKVTM